MPSIMWEEITYPFQTSTITPWKFGNGYATYSIPYNDCNALSMMELMVIYIIKGGPDTIKHILPIAGM